MITVHHLDDSRSQRILWLLEELGEPYEIERHRRDPQRPAAVVRGAGLRNLFATDSHARQHARLSRPGNHVFA